MIFVLLELAPGTVTQLVEVPAESMLVRTCKLQPIYAGGHDSATFVPAFVAIPPAGQHSPVGWCIRICERPRRNKSGGIIASVSDQGESDAIGGIHLAEECHAIHGLVGVSAVVACGCLRGNDECAL